MSCFSKWFLCRVLDFFFLVIRFQNFVIQNYCFLFIDLWSDKDICDRLKTFVLCGPLWIWVPLLSFWLFSRQFRSSTQCVSLSPVMAVVLLFFVCEAPVKYFNTSFKYPFYLESFLFVTSPFLPKAFSIYVSSLCSLHIFPFNSAFINQSLQSYSML